jgi:hypothetical protein
MREDQAHEQVRSYLFFFLFPTRFKSNFKCRSRFMNQYYMHNHNQTPECK